MNSIDALNATYVFIGNRVSVLEKMIKCGCNIKEIIAIKDSYLAKTLEARQIEYYMPTSKMELIKHLKDLEYDVLVSNGCPYILPISSLDNGRRLFINIHPSLLPDLKGKSPINGAILFAREHGVTCHKMDDGIDTGEIISQIEIPITDDICLDLLYFLSFKYEGEVFEKAYYNNFRPEEKSYCKKEPIYYSRREEDMLLKESDNIELFLRKIKAFSTEGQYAKIVIANYCHSVKNAVVVNNRCAKELFGNESGNSVVAKYGKRYILALIRRELVQLELFDISKIEVGDKVFE